MVNAGQWLRRDTPLNRALFIAVFYAVIAGSWVAFSDRALVALIDDPLSMAWAQTLKGGFFVLVTALLLFVLVHRAAHGLLRGYRAALNATRDELTGLAGRAALRDLGPRIIARAREKEEPAAFILVDVDRLRRVNDALGVGAGNAVLVEVAHRLRWLHRPDISLLRLGSDEFLLMIAPPCMNEDAQSLALEVLTELGKPYDVAGEALQIDVTAGIAMYPRHGSTVDELAHAAETAMMEARENRKRMAFFTGPGEDSRHLLSLENALPKALGRGQFQLYYQPLVNLEDGHIVGAEALIRWSHPDFGLVSPGQFIPLLEQNGGIHEVGAWALKVAINDMLEWPAQNGIPPYVSVNVSRLQLETPDFLALVQRCMKRPGLERGRVLLEITETMAMANPEVILGRLEALRDSGLQLAMDDFGTGYSSLSYLKRFPFEYVKIDRAFVKGIPGDRENDMLVQTMGDMTHRLRRQTVAEGVETVAEAERLREFGFRTAQGFLYSKPVPADEFRGLMEIGYRFEETGEAPPPLH